MKKFETNKQSFYKNFFYKKYCFFYYVSLYLLFLNKTFFVFETVALLEDATQTTV